jgi:pimeloyl-ACP methyl ester carboxylesterase
MDRAKVNGVELEYEVSGSGEPLLLISPVVADAFSSFMSQRRLTDNFRLIRYHKRGWVGSTHTPGPVSVADHARDAAALLERLGVDRAHVAGHSSGGAVALELARQRPELVRSLVLLEPALLWVPSAGAFFAKAGPAFELYRAGKKEEAVGAFLAVASGFEVTKARAVIDASAPGSIRRAVDDADTFFGIELPALGEWKLTPEDAAKISQPALSLVGSNSDPVFVEGADFLRRTMPNLTEQKLEGIGHLLQIERVEPVVRAIADFLLRPAPRVSTPQERISQPLGAR